MKAKTFEQLTKSKYRISVKKSDNDKMQVFGWASVAVRSDGEVIEDYQDDIIDPDVLEAAAYRFVASFGTGGEMHERGGVSRLIESIVFTKEKADVLGIPKDVLPVGWWVGFQVDDTDVWDMVKDSTYSMFSIEGTGVRVPEDDE